MDEIQPEIGEDAEGRGLLDRWDHTDDHADRSDDSTESVAVGAHHSQTRQHVLSELFSALDAAIADPHSPAPEFRRALSTEPLDPLVPLNGLQASTTLRVLSSVRPKCPPPRSPHRA